MLRSGIGRLIDPRHPSNLFIVAAALSGGAVVFFPTLGDGFGDAFSAAALAGGAAFLSWAVARELDPDRPWVAGVAAVGAWGASFIADPSLVVIGAALLAARVLVRSTGFAPTHFDVLVLIGVGTIAAMRATGFPVALVLAASLIFDVRLPRGSRHRVTVGGYALVAIATVAAAASGTLSPNPVSFRGVEWLLLATAVIGAVLVLRPPITTARTDWTSETLDDRRLRAARLGALAAVAGAGVWGGALGLGAVMPVAIGMVAGLLPSLLPRVSAATA